MKGVLVMSTMSKLEHIMENKTRREILEILAEKGLVEFAELAATIKTSQRVDYHLSFLQSQGIVERESRGIYRLNPRYVTMVRSKLKVSRPHMLIGGLGKEITLYVDLLDALKYHGYEPSKIIYITSPEVRDEVIKSYGKDKTANTEFIVFPYVEVLRENIEVLLEASKNLVEKHIYRFEPLIDLTGGTKPTSLALLKVAQEYNLKALYFSSRKIIWINKPY